MMTANPISLDQIAALVHVETIGWVGWITRRIENAGGREGVAGAPADHLAADCEIEIARGKSSVGFLHAASGSRIGVRGGKADEAA